ncbi:MAG: AtuA-related protein, partial [Acidimicrobiia bacterium]
ATPYAVYWPTTLPAGEVEQRVVVGVDAVQVHPTVPGSPATVVVSPPSLPGPPGGPTARLPLGRAFGARSGDKGGNANLGVWARSPEGYAWLVRYLTVGRVRELIPETRGLGVERFELPNLLALNFVVRGLLGDGVAASPRVDPQAKTLGEYLRAKLVDLPEALLDRPPGS